MSHIKEIKSMSKTPRSRYEDRVKTLKRRSTYLKGRIADYKGADPSRDKAEMHALDWALRVIESNAEAAIKLINETPEE